MESNRDEERRAKGLFTWREEDPSTRKILGGETTFRLVYIQKFQSGWLPSGEGKQLPPCLFCFVPSTMIFPAKVVYMMLGRSYR